MKKIRTTSALILFPLLLLTLTSGIYRHDTPIEKYVALAREEQFNCTGEIIAVRNGKPEGIGSFVLIDSLTILSAAHCFTGELKKDTVVNYQGQKYKTYVVRGLTKLPEKEFLFHIFNAYLPAKSITFHPNYLKDKTCDLAIIKLEKPLTGFKSIPLTISTNEVNDTVTGVGFGTSGPANSPELVAPYHIKLAGQNIIDSIGGFSLNGKPTMLYADFDSPDNRQGCNLTGSSKPLKLEYSIGAGDSGGPLFCYRKGKLYLTGIATFAPKTVSNLLKNGYYCELNGWTRISTFADWISENK